MKKKRAAKNIFFSALQQLVAIICGFIVPRLIIKTYGSSVNGMISSITQFLAYITLLEAGVGPVIKSQLYKPISTKDNEEIENILYASEKYCRTIAIIFIFYILVLLVLYPFFVDNSFSRIFSSLLIIIIAISSFAEYYFGMTYRLFLYSDKKSYVISIIQIITTIINAAVTVVLALYNVNILLVKLISSLIFTLRPICQLLYVKKNYSFNKKNINKNYKLKNKWDGLAQHIAAVIYGNTDIALLTIFTSIIEVSIYSVYYLVTNSLQKIIQSVSDGLEAFFGDMIAKKDDMKLKEWFNSYEVFYYTIIAIIYICALLLMIPFVTVYTSGVKDANYVIPTFGMIMVISGFIYAIKIPYHSLVKTAGHFKQTRAGAWLEAILNMIISLMLVFKYGLIGVVVGTIISTMVRALELIIYSCKKIINGNVMTSIMKIVICITEVLLFAPMINKIINYSRIHSFMSFISYSFLTACLSSLLVVGLNIVIYWKTIRKFGSYFKMFKNNNGRQ